MKRALQAPHLALPLAPVGGPSSERAFRRWPNCQLLLCFICPCRSALFAAVLVHGPSSERALHRRPCYHLPFVSFAHFYGARAKRASLSFAFLLNFPPLWRTARAGQLAACLPLWRAVRARSERSAGGPVISCFYASSAPCLSALFAPVMARGP